MGSILATDMHVTLVESASQRYRKSWVFPPPPKTNL
jgi:hypothetical protein